MTFRIVKEDNWYYIEKRALWFFWVDVVIWYGGDYMRQSFHTLEQAEAYVNSYPESIKKKNTNVIKEIQIPKK